MGQRAAGPRRNKRLSTLCCVSFFNLCVAGSLIDIYIRARRTRQPRQAQLTGTPNPYVQPSIGVDRAGARWLVVWSILIREPQRQHPGQGMSEALDRHYDAVASHYQQAWFYEDGTDYQRWLTQQLAVRWVGCCWALGVECLPRLGRYGWLWIPCV